MCMRPPGRGRTSAGAGKAGVLCSFLSWLSVAVILYLVGIYSKDSATAVREERSVTLSNYTADDFLHITNFSAAKPVEEECEGAISHFPAGLFSAEQLKHGAFIVPLLVAAYMIVALTIVCDEYFVPSMACICESLGLAPDVAGATFMAIGSSAPEFFTAIIGIVMTESDISLGTILGSIAFNILFILGILGIVFGVSSKVYWWPLLRDLVCYVISVIALTLVIMDGKVYWYESLILISMYALYVLVMYFNEKLRESAEGAVNGFWKNREAENGDELRSLNNKENHNEIKGVVKIDNTQYTENGSNGLVILELDSLTNVSQEQEQLPKDDSENCCELRLPEGIMARIGWLLTLPITIVFLLTIPDCKKKKCRKFYMVTMVIAAIWLGALSYVLIWMMTEMGFTFGIPDSVMALIFLGAGSSVPDLVASYLVAKEGHWNMAIANCLGSNIFEVLLCLSLPWLFAALTVSELCVDFLATGMSFVAVMLILVVIISVVAIICNGWILDRKLGVFNLLMYIVFMVGTLLFGTFVSPNIFPGC